jgi:hypothetical protein
MSAADTRQRDDGRDGNPPPLHERFQHLLSRYRIDAN